MGRSKAAVGTVCLVVGVFLGLSLGDQSPSIAEWIYKYQTLLSGLLALAAAAWGVSAIHRQIRQADDIETERLASRRAAARAVLPLGLSSISEYAERCARMLYDLLAQCVDGELPHTVVPPPLPPLPTDAISSLKEMTETAKAAERAPLADLLAKIQVQRSRLQSSISRSRSAGEMVLEANINEYIIDSAEIYARSAKIFNYARGKADNISSSSPTLEDYTNALHNLGIFDETHDGLVAVLKRRL